MDDLNPKDNRISIKCEGAAFLPLRTLTAFQGGLKKISRANLDKLKKRIVEDGFISPVFVWVNGNVNYLLDGHQRLQALNALVADGYEISEVPVAYIHADSEEEARKRLLSITSQYGEFDLDEIEGWLADFDADFAESLRLVDEEMELVFGEPKETEGDDDTPEPPEEPVTKLGDLWELGGHRLLCADSTKLETLEKLCGDTMMDLFITDPPYNVNYVGKTKKSLKIENDKMGDSAFRDFLRDANIAADSKMKPGAVFYIWHADSEGYNFRGACIDVGWKVRQCLIWNKNAIVMGRQDYHWKHEPCLYGWKEGSGHLWASDRKQATVLNFDRPSRSEEHPTMKPVKLFEYCVLNNTKELDAVLDTFGGSGTSLIVCEKNNRKAYIVELGPNYCDAIVNRYKTWCENNGRTPVIKLNGEAWNG